MDRAAICAEREATKKRYAEWSHIRRVHEGRGRVRVERLAGKRPGDWDPRPRWQDHCRLWIRDGKPVCFTTEPYGLNQDDVQEIKQLAHELGLVVIIRQPAESLWYPGSTHLVEFWTQDALSWRRAVVVLDR